MLYPARCRCSLAALAFLQRRSSMGAWQLNQLTDCVQFLSVSLSAALYVCGDF